MAISRSETVENTFLLLLKVLAPPHSFSTSAQSACASRDGTAEPSYSVTSASDRAGVALRDLGAAVESRRQRNIRISIELCRTRWIVPQFLEKGEQIPHPGVTDLQTLMRGVLERRSNRISPRIGR